MDEDMGRGSKEPCGKLSSAAVLALMVSVLAVVATLGTVLFRRAIFGDALAIYCVGGFGALAALVVSLVLGILAWRREGGRTGTPKIVVWTALTVLAVVGASAYLKLTPPSGTLPLLTFIAVTIATYGLIMAAPSLESSVIRRFVGQRKRLLKLAICILWSSAGLGLAIGLGWAIWGDYRGSSAAVVLVGTVVGAILGLPVITCLVVDASLTRFTGKVAASLLPLLILSFCVPYYGGLVMFLQLSAVLIPSFAPRSWWLTLLVSLAGGFGFLTVWYLLRSSHLAPLRSSDDIFVFYPLAIFVVSVTAAIAAAFKSRTAQLATQ